VAAALTAKAVGTLSAQTRELLKSKGIAEDFVDVAYAAGVLEADIAGASRALFVGRGHGGIARFGNQWIPTVDLGGLVLDPGPGSWRVPGPCRPSVHDTPVASEPTVPPTEISSIRPIGIADLLQVRQAVKRYALGEIAHIENIMRGELRDRTHRHSTSVSETVAIETERTSEESRDLQTAERFELQQETSRIIREEASREVALSISASYGPFVEGTANITFGHSESSEESTRNATRYSREVTDRAVKKVQERILERRTTTTVREIEEINKHTFANQDSADHIRGLYRWVDKIYEAQVVSYGLRMIYEVVVPEPAAFYRHALSAAPREGMTLRRPDPPGYCVHPGGAFTALVPGDLDDSNYQFWVSQYGATGVEPPPALHRTIGMTMSVEKKDDEPFVTLTSTELQVPDGYRAERAFVRGGGLLWDVADPEEFLNFHVGRTFLGIGQAGAMNGEDGAIPVVGHGYNVAAIAVTIEVLCVRTKEAFETWRLATFGAIMTAYNELKSQYESELARIEVNLQNNAAIFGRNPELNRDIERTELKRGALTLLSGQHFDVFDAMRGNVPPHGYPQMDRADAEAEGAYIQFFEQAFEWANVSYRFYPYFWGRKSAWPSSLQLDDRDPLFGRFLQAGAARVQVPVRPGFEQAVVWLLQTGNRPWEEEGAFEIGGSLYRSMIDEITEELRGAFTRGVGTLAVEHDNAIVTGSGTAFDADLHTGRDIIILERTYQVSEVMSPTELRLDRPYADPSDADVAYAFGARLVGDPWEVRVPTNLVMLQEGHELPDLSDN